MAAIAQSFPASNRPLAWLWEWLKDELTPYPGRGLLVARMVTAATLVMIISMTFQLPYGAYAALYALNLSRESLEGSRRAVQSIVVGFAFAGAYILTGTLIVIGDPLLRFLWIVATLFLIFYGISATGSFAAWTRFGYMAVITITLWDRHIGAQAKVKGLLWAIGMLTMASLIALLLEFGYAALRQGDDVMDPITERLECVEQLLRSCAGDCPVDAVIHSRIMRLATLGTSRLRHLISTRSYNGAQYIQQMGALAALTGRLVDLAANLPRFASHGSGVNHDRIDKVANRIAQIRHGLENRTFKYGADLGQIDPRPGLPLLGEIETTVALIPEVFSGSQSLRIFDSSAARAGDRQPVGTRSTWLNPEHLKFGLKGCLAASFCYIIYSALFWPEISTSVTTCLLTALTTIGASRQKQVLRFAGALLGGFVFGMGAQIFILPAHRLDCRLRRALRSCGDRGGLGRHIESSTFVLRRADCIRFLSNQPPGIQDTDLADSGKRSGGRHITGVVRDVVSLRPPLERAGRYRNEEGIRFELAAARSAYARAGIERSPNGHRTQLLSSRNNQCPIRKGSVSCRRGSVRIRPRAAERSRIAGLHSQLSAETANAFLNAGSVMEIPRPSAWVV